MRKAYIVMHERPVNLDLGSLKFPPMAIASILHRISGVVLFLLLPMMLYFLSLSLESEATFSHLSTIVLAHSCYKLLLWVFSSALFYHVIAGIRHLLMDIGYGETLHAGRRSAIVVIGLSVLATVFLGVFIW